MCLLWSKKKVLLQLFQDGNPNSNSDIVRRAGAGEKIIDTVDFTLEPQCNQDDSTEEKVEALAEIICRSGGEAAAALFVLMGTMENSRDPKLLANTAKHFAFTHCGESNLFGMVDAQPCCVSVLRYPISGLVTRFMGFLKT